MLLSTSKNNDDSLTHGVKIISKNTTKLSTKINNNNKSTSTSNATLDQLLKSLDDINSYLEKKFTQNNNCNTYSENKKFFEKKNSETELFHKESIKCNNNSSSELDKYAYLNLTKLQHNNRHKMSTEK